jgi:hypothetical protein
MATKEDLHKLKIKPWYAPIGENKTSPVAALSALDTAGFESNMFVLVTGELTGSATYVISLYESDTGGSDVGAMVKPEDVIFAVDDNNDVTLDEYVVVAGTSQVLTTTTSDDGRAMMWAYIGSKRYIRLHITGTDVGVLGVISVQGHFRYPGRLGLHAKYDTE